MGDRESKAAASSDGRNPEKAEGQHEHEPEHATPADDAAPTVDDTTRSDAPPRQDAEDEKRPSWRIGPWRLWEPATTLTNVVLAVGALAVAAWLLIATADSIWRAAVGGRVPLLGLSFAEWLTLLARLGGHGLAFGGAGVAAAAGAVVHGSDARRSGLRRIGWRIVTGSMVASGIGILVLAGSLAEGLPLDAMWKGIVGGAALVAIVLTVFLLPRREGVGFEHAQAWVGAAALMTLGLRLILAAAPDASTWHRQGALWWAVGCAAYAVATLIQRRHVSPHRHFDHNALFHVGVGIGLFAFNVAAGNDIGELIMRGVWRVE